MRVLALAEETLVAGGNIARGGAGWNSASGTSQGAPVGQAVEEQEAAGRAVPFPQRSSRMKAQHSR